LWIFTEENKFIKGTGDDICYTYIFLFFFLKPFSVLWIGFIIEIAFLGVILKRNPGKDYRKKDQPKTRELLTTI